MNLELECLSYEKLSTLTAAKGFTGAKIVSGARRAKVALISVEEAAIRFTMDGTTPVVTGASEAGHLLQVGESYEILGHKSIVNFRCINAVNGNGAELFCSFYY
jgi:hypothetical protein